MHPSKPRQRIIAAARELFRLHGMRGVGVEAIAEAAGTNKMTLYRHFGSKDELIAACLSAVAADVEAIWRSFETRFPGDPRAQLSAWIDFMTVTVCEDRQGCELANAAVELAETNDPAYHIIERFKTDQRNRLAQICRSADIADADVLADTLLLLFEGACVNSQSVGSNGPWTRVSQTAEAVIAAFGRAKPGGTSPTPTVARRKSRAGR